MISIDNADIGGVSIGGEEVVEITIDGDVVWTGTESSGTAIIDTFDDDTYDGWGENNLENVDFVDGYNGNRAVRLHTKSGSYSGTGAISTSSKLPPLTDGDIIEWYWKWDYDGKIRVSFYDDSGARQLQTQIRPNSIDEDHDLTTPEENIRSSGDASANTWYRNELQLHSNSVTWIMENLSGTTIWSHTAEIDTLNDLNEIQLQVARNYNLDWGVFDDIRVI